MTGGLWSYIPGAYNALVHATPEQRTRYLDPYLRGERSGSYAVTEADAGSDARNLAATAVRDAATGDYVLNGEKWFVTGPDDTDFMIFHCLVVEPDGDVGNGRPTLFLVDYDEPGVTLKHDPDYMHTFADRHPQFVLEDVRVPATAVLGGVGKADDLTNEWFVEERIHIGARCSGAMERLLTLAIEWATGRVQFGERIYDFQGVSFPLADSAADASAARLLTREAAWLADSGADPKVVHAKASLAKLFASEAAFRCADRVVQVFGGRGYMREFPAERFFRELRVDRIWEGTSEIQRLIIARSLESEASPGSSGEPRHVAGNDGPTGDRPQTAVRAPFDRRRRRVGARWDRDDRREQLGGDGQRHPLPLRQSPLHRAERSALLSVARCPARAAGLGPRRRQSPACHGRCRGCGARRRSQRDHPRRRRRRGR